MKKKLLFVIDSLVCAGAEKSLVTLLSLLDYDRYDVDLQLISYGGEFQQYVPKEVNLLPPLEYFAFTSQSFKQQLLSLDFKKLAARIGYSIAIRKKRLNHADRARLLWEKTRSSIPYSQKKYDVAIAYAHNYPTFYVAKRVNAVKKMAWVNVDLHLSEPNRSFQRGFYDKIDEIVAVSDSAYAQFGKCYPEYIERLSVVYDIIDDGFIGYMSEQENDVGIYAGENNLLTVARLNKPQKGYDIALDACRILKERRICFKWYAIGRGDYRHEMERYIAEHGLQDTFILLGTKANPYPYFKACDLYVQTSRHEGFGLSIAEARILNKPVVTTEFDAVWNQMVQGKNGVVVPQNPVAVADAIEDLLKHPEKMKAISDYQKSEKKSNKEELEKFYQLIDGEK